MSLNCSGSDLKKKRVASCGQWIVGFVGSRRTNTRGTRKNRLGIHHDIWLDILTGVHKIPFRGQEIYVFACVDKPNCFVLH